MWTPGRLSSNSGLASPFWWKKKKKGTSDSFSFISDDDNYSISSTLENPSPLCRRTFTPTLTPAPHLKNPNSLSSSLLSRFWRRPSKTSKSSHRRLSATIYGPRRGRANLSLQEHPCSEPLLLLELAIATGKLVREMSSGPVRILLECPEEQTTTTTTTTTTTRKKKKKKKGLWEEPVWNMYCNGARSGYAVSHHCGEVEIELLKKLEKVSVGAGVLNKIGEEEEMMYMRAKFERVVDGKDSENLYMVNPDGGGRSGPELSIFFFRL